MLHLDLSDARVGFEELFEKRRLALRRILLLAGQLLGERLPLVVRLQELGLLVLDLLSEGVDLVLHLLGVGVERLSCRSELRLEFGDSAVGIGAELVHLDGVIRDHLLRLDRCHLLALRTLRQKHLHLLVGGNVRVQLLLLLRQLLLHLPQLPLANFHKLRALLLVHLRQLLVVKDVFAFFLETLLRLLHLLPPRLQLVVLLLERLGSLLRFRARPLVRRHLLDGGARSLTHRLLLLGLTHFRLVHARRHLQLAAGQLRGHILLPCRHRLPHLLHLERERDNLQRDRFRGRRHLFLQRSHPLFRRLPPRNNVDGRLHSRAQPRCHPLHRSHHLSGRRILRE
mmetsp:Transcript_68843/g.158114  ORF Transcript_68843/g.158114 Transcript_68843/m.158114 type:complete len:341 (+) Transcript_68843:384-1406(+)